MKKAKLVILAMMCMLLSTGCIRYETTVEVKKNGKADVSMIYAVSDFSEMNDMIGGDDNEDFDFDFDFDDEDQDVTEDEITEDALVDTGFRTVSNLSTVEEDEELSEEDLDILGELGSLFGGLEDEDNEAEIDEDTSAIPAEDIKKIEDAGWKVTDYSKNGFIGYEISKKNIGLTKISGELNDLYAILDNDAEEALEEEDAEESKDSKEESGFFIEKKGFNYVVNWKIMSDEDAEQMKQSSEYMKMSGAKITCKLILPYAAKSNNATKVTNDGKTLEWDAFDMEEGVAKAEFSIINVTLIIILAVIALVVIVGIILIVVLGGKKKNTAAEQTPAVTEEVAAEETTEASEETNETTEI
ncbi:MAG: hypothetical protein K6G26_09710 [Lachnospiraceae bacterium]|nr:hypothetical protein [Lachnospiraceae bacterium]